MKKVVKNLLLITVMTVLCMVVAVTAGAVSSGDFTYEIVDGEATIIGYTGNGGNVTVPSELDGYTVTAIGDQAFCSFYGEAQQLPAYKITELVLPDTIKTIGEGAFARFNMSYYLRFYLDRTENITIDEVKDLSVFVPSSVEKIDEMAFICIQWKGSKENYTELKINVFYEGTEAQWNSLYNESGMREESTQEIEINSGYENFLGDTINSVGYTDKNNIHYNCTGLQCSHKWVYDRTDVNDCEIGGFKYYSCSMCGETKKETYGKREHGTLTETWRQEPTCGTEGYINYDCDQCLYGKTVILPATGAHDWYPDYGEGGSYSCTEGGMLCYWCENCGANKWEYTAPIGSHLWDDYPSEEELSSFCGVRNYEFGCERCERYGNESFTGRKEHNICWRSNNDATCTEDGTKTAYCTDCDTYEYEILIEPDVGSAFGHDYNSWIDLSDVSCTQDGISVRSCKRCALIDVNKEKAYGHDDNNGDGKCDECKIILESSGAVTPEAPEENKKEDNVFSFLTNFLNSILDLFRKLFGIA